MFLTRQWDQSEELALLAHHYQLGDIIERSNIITFFCTLLNVILTFNIQNMYL